jgi:hypothetical protein
MADCNQDVSPPTTAPSSVPADFTMLSPAEVHALRVRLHAAVAAKEKRQADGTEPPYYGIYFGMSRK